jgi:hypothetical protein
MGRPVTELPASPGQQQLPPTSPLCSAAAPVEDIENTDGVGYTAAEGSQTTPAASSEIETAVRAPRKSYTVSQFVSGAATDPALSPTPSNAGPSPTAPQTGTSTTPPDPPSDEVDIPQPLFFTQPSSPRRERGQEPEADTCRGSPGGKSKPRGKRRLDNLEGSDSENAPCVKRARRQVDEVG